MKQLTDSQNWRPQNQVEEGTWPRIGGGRCGREGETGTKQRRRRRRVWVVEVVVVVYSCSVSREKREKGGRSSE